MEELKDGWRRVKLGEVCEIIFSGGTPNTKISEYWNGNINWLSSGETRHRYIKTTEKKITKNGVENSSTKLALKNDVVVASAGQGFTRGQTSYCLINTYINQSVISLRSNFKVIDSKYLFFNIISRYNELRHLSDGNASRGSLTTKIMKDLDIFLPPLETQEKIASILSALDDKIEINNEMNKTLEEMAQTLFKRWFIDFDFPNENGEPYRSSGGKMVDSELGEIPEGWEIEKLSKIIEINPKESLKKGEKSIYVEMKSLSENSSIISNYIVRNFTGSGTKFKNRDTLMARITPCLENGKTGFINFLDNEITAWGSTEFNVLRSKKNIPKELSYFIARDQSFRKYAIGNMNGSSGRQRISGKILEEYKLAIANDFNLYQRFGFVISKLMDKIENNRKEIKSLTETRDTLLPKLMSGEVEV